MELPVGTHRHSSVLCLLDNGNQISFCFVCFETDSHHVSLTDLELAVLQGWP